MFIPYTFCYFQYSRLKFKHAVYSDGERQNFRRRSGYFHAKKANKIISEKKKQRNGVILGKKTGTVTLKWCKFSPAVVLASDSSNDEHQSTAKESSSTEKSEEYESLMDVPLTMDINIYGVGKFQTKHSGASDFFTFFRSDVCGVQRTGRFTAGSFVNNGILYDDGKQTIYADRQEVKD